MPQLNQLQQDEARASRIGVGAGRTEREWPTSWISRDLTWNHGGSSMQDAARRPANDSALRSRGMVWKSQNAGPLSRILAKKPDFTALVVDSSPEMRSLTRTMLKSLGVFSIAEATSPADGIACTRKTAPDIAVVDLDASAESGLTFLRTLRQDHRSPAPRLPVLMTTAAPNLQQIVTLRDAGANDVLAKPISPNAMAKHMLVVLENPAEFIETADYCGPDRRRREIAFAGVNRRRSSSKLQKFITRYEDRDYLPA